MDGGSAASLINSALRISQIIYELAAVGEQARDLLSATKHVARSLETTQTLRRQKSLHLNATEKTWIDEIMVDASHTLNNVATLVEPVRVDMQTKHGKIGLVNRGLFVFRDCPKVPTQLTQLSITGQNLNTALSILSQREPSAPQPLLRSPPLKHRASMASITTTCSHPPTYEESEFLNRRRKPPVSPDLQTKSREQPHCANDPILQPKSHDPGHDSNCTNHNMKNMPAGYETSPSNQVSDENPTVTEDEADSSKVNPHASQSSFSSVSTPFDQQSYNTSKMNWEKDFQSAQQQYRAYTGSDQSNSWTQEANCAAQETPRIPQHSLRPYNLVTRVYPPDCSARPVQASSATYSPSFPPMINVPHLPGQSGLDLHLPPTPPDTYPSRNIVYPALPISPPASSTKSTFSDTSSSLLGYPLEPTASEPVLPYPSQRSHMCNTAFLPFPDERRSFTTTYGDKNPQVGLGLMHSTPVQMPEPLRGPPSPRSPSPSSSYFQNRSSSRTPAATTTTAAATTTTTAAAAAAAAATRTILPPSLAVCGQRTTGEHNPHHEPHSAPPRTTTTTTTTTTSSTMLSPSYIPQTGRMRRYAWLERHASQ